MSGRVRPVVAGTAVGVAALALLSTLGVAVATGAFHSSSHAPNGRCSAPRLAGPAVDVRLVDMRGAMPMMGAVNGGMMRVVVDRATVPAGRVSFRVANVGHL